MAIALQSGDGMSGASARPEAQGPEAMGMPPHNDLVVEVDGLPHDAWDRLIGEFNDASYEQSTCLLDDRWGSKRVSHLVLRRGGVAVGGARLLLLKPPLLSTGLAQAKFAPFWLRRDRPADPADYRSLLAALVEEYCGRRGCYLSVVPRPHPDHYTRETAMLAELGFEVRHPSFDDIRFFVNLGIGPDALMASLDQKWRRNLRQALEGNLEFRFGFTDEAFRSFFDMHQAMLARKGLHSDDPIHLLPTLTERLPQALRPQIALALHEGRPVAGAVVVVSGDLALYLYGASTDAALPLKAGYGLQWQIACRLAEQELRWYDLGGGNDPGLHQFKRGFVGKKGVVLPLHGEYGRSGSVSGQILTDMLYVMRNAQLRIRRLRSRG